MLISQFFIPSLYFLQFFLLFLPFHHISKHLAYDIFPKNAIRCQWGFTILQLHWKLMLKIKEFLAIEHQNSVPFSTDTSNQPIFIIFLQWCLSTTRHKLVNESLSHLIDFSHEGIRIFLWFEKAIIFSIIANLCNHIIFLVNYMTNSIEIDGPFSKYNTVYDHSWNWKLAFVAIIELDCYQFLHSSIKIV